MPTPSCLHDSCSYGISGRDGVSWCLPLHSEAELPTTPDIPCTSRGNLSCLAGAGAPLLSTVKGQLKCPLYLGPRKALNIFSYSNIPYIPAASSGSLSRCNGYPEALPSLLQHPHQRHRLSGMAHMGGWSSLLTLSTPYHIYQPAPSEH